MKFYPPFVVARFLATKFHFQGNVQFRGKIFPVNVQAPRDGRGVALVISELSEFSCTTEESQALCEKLQTELDLLHDQVRRVPSLKRPEQSSAA